MLKTQKAEFSSERWDKKKIVLAIFVVLALAVAGLQVRNYVLGDSTQDVSYAPSKEVKGENISSSPTISLPTAQEIGQEVSENLLNIKQEIDNIDIQGLATSSPQVKKILEDIRALPNYPASQTKDICLNICNSL